MRRVRQVVLFLAVICPLCWPQDHGSVKWNHKPDSKIGPANWGSLDPTYKACGSGELQTPIRLPFVAPNAPRVVDFHYSKFTSEVWNTGHVVEVCALKDEKPDSPAGGHKCEGTNRMGGYITIGDREPFYLKEFHLHAPSEHTFNGKELDLEVHLVHVAESGKVAVVGILMGKTQGQGNGVVKDVIAKAPKTTEQGPEDARITVDPSRLVTVGTSFFAYTGSLTTPDCKEGLQWRVAKNPDLVDAADLKTLHDIISRFPGYEGYPNNNRRPVPEYLTDRKVVLVPRAPARK